MGAALRFLDILQILARHQVDYILVGGVAAILEGAPVSTFDVDIVVPSESENNARLLGVQVRTLKLEKIILSKEQANRDKDKAALHTLRRALLLKGRSGS
jgi:hypothetical protein